MTATSYNCKNWLREELLEYMNSNGGEVYFRNPSTEGGYILTQHHLQWFSCWVKKLDYIRDVINADMKDDHRPSRTKRWLQSIGFIEPAGTVKPHNSAAHRQSFNWGKTRIWKVDVTG